MTSPAIRLAKELCICAVIDGRIVPAMPSEGLFVRQLETFYAKAQAQALRDAADLVHDDYGCDVDSAAKLRRMAGELERGA